MRSFELLIQLAFAMAWAESGMSGDRATIFPREFFSGNPDLLRPRNVQIQGIRDLLGKVNEGESQNSYGFAANGIRLGIFILDPNSASQTRIYTAVVLRNDSVEPFTYHGMDNQILEIVASGSSGESLKRTRTGSLFHGSSLASRSRLPMMKLPKVTIPAGGQVVYEINLATLFEIPVNEAITVSSVARPLDDRWKSLLESKSPSVVVTPKQDTCVPSVYDGPFLPESVLTAMKNYRQTNAVVERSNFAAQIAQARAERKASPFYSNHLANVRSNEILRATQWGGSVVPLPTNKVADPTPPSNVEPVGEAIAPSHIKYYLAGIVLALLAISGFFLRRK